MRKAEIICALVLLAVAGIGMAEAIRLGSGWGPSGPRAGFFPIWLSAILGLCGLSILVKAMRMNPFAEVARKPFLSRSLLKPVLAVFLPMVAAVVLFEVIGFYLAAALYLGIFMRWMGRHSWLAVLAASLLFPAATFLILERWFLIPLPKGMLANYLPF